MTAADALQGGLVSEVFPHDDFHREVESRVATMAQLPPKVIIFFLISLFIRKKIALTSRTKMSDQFTIAIQYNNIPCTF